MLIVVFAASFSAASAADSRPNVLFLMSDDLNNMLGCYGDPLTKTPNIDRLAARGVRFDRAYCSLSPLRAEPQLAADRTVSQQHRHSCESARFSGRRSRSSISMPQAFRLPGYFAARIGKLYHYDVPRSIGTNGHDDPGSWELELNPAGVDRLEEQPQIFTLTPGQFGGTLSWYASPKSDEYHTDGLDGRGCGMGSRTLRKTAGPAVLPGCRFLPSAYAVRVAEDRTSTVPGREMPVVQGVKEDQADIPPAGLASYKKEQDKLTDELRRECRQAYNASISSWMRRSAGWWTRWIAWGSPRTRSSSSPAITAITWASTACGRR